MTERISSIHYSVGIAIKKYDDVLIYMIKIKFNIYIENV